MARAWVTKVIDRHGKACRPGERKRACVGERREGGGGGGESGQASLC